MTDRFFLSRRKTSTARPAKTSIAASCGSKGFSDKRLRIPQSRSNVKHLKNNTGKHDVRSELAVTAAFERRSAHRATDRLEDDGDEVGRAEGPEVHVRRDERVLPADRFDDHAEEAIAGGRVEAWRQNQASSRTRLVRNLSRITSMDRTGGSPDLLNKKCVERIDVEGAAGPADPANDFAQSAEDEDDEPPDPRADKVDCLDARNEGEGDEEYDARRETRGVPILRGPEERESSGLNRRIGDTLAMLKSSSPESLTLD